MLNRIFSVDSAKALKAQSFGYLNGIHYMAPHRTAGVGDLCGHASAGCIALCLGLYSGQAAMVADDSDLEGNSVRKSRADKARRFMRDRQIYMRDVFRSIELLVLRAKRMNLKLCIRMNGSTDIAWEGIRYNGRNVFDTFPDIDFVDYTKNPKRFTRPLPPNLHMTFSRSETNEAQCLELLNRGVNVAVVFETVPKRWNGFKVIDGDKHDLRQLDPRGRKGVVIGLLPKGNHAKRDKSGFVVRP
jgi:hypothetical protein